MSSTMNDFVQATKASESWFSEDTEPDPAPLPKICGYNILVKPLGVKKKVGNIHLPDSVRDDAQALTNVGRVLITGPEAYQGERFTSQEPWCKPGDYVVFQKFRGVKILYKNVPLTLLADDEILMVVDKPDEINSNFFNFSKASV